MLSLSSPITSLYMIAAGYAKRLEKLGIKTVSDLLYHLPFRYDDFSLVSKISLLQVGEKVSVVGEIIKINNLRTKFGKNIQVAVLADETGKIELVWYNQPYLRNVLQKGVKVTVAGEVKWFNHKLVFESPEYELCRLTPVECSPFARSTSSPHGVASTGQATRLIHTARLVPVYPETQGVSSKWLRSRIDTLLHKIFPEIAEFLPADIRNRFQIITEEQALYQVHFPKNYQEVREGRDRLGFDELLILQLAAAIRKKEWQKIKTQNKFEISLYKDKLKKFVEDLPFDLTSAQKRAVSDILTDLTKTTPMNRLLEGDVGSGKTVVAAIAIYLSYLNGYTSILMAPTEILSRQHFQTLENLFKPLKIGVKLIVSGWKDEKRKYPVYVGTHALLSEKFSVDNLGLAVIDEQQRFGVEQRAKLRNLGNSPHVLTMTATPIPRTIALTLLSDLDLSVLDEMPKGRLKIKTWVVPPVKRLAAYEWIRKQITSKIHQQAFIICPFIEPSESLSSVKAAKSEYEKIQKDIFPDLKVGLLHGKMKKEKEKTLNDFKNGIYDVLVATPIVEVGIDIPRTTIILIETAERFGLSQLHQLRGRVGRSDLQSYCLLFTDSLDPKTLKRLKYLETVHDGPRLANFDFKIRGSGEIYGTRQHGILDLKVADITDMEMIEKTKKAAQMILEGDETLSGFPLLRQKLQKYTIKEVSPD